MARDSAGLKFEIELEAKFQKGQASLWRSIWNRQPLPILMCHCEFVNTPDGEVKTYKQACKQLPAQTQEIKPHPYGVELGVLIKMLHDTQARTLQSFLHTEFSRVSTRVAKLIAEAAKLSEKARPTRIARKRPMPSTRPSTRLS